MKAARVLMGLVLLAAAWIAGFGYGRWYGPATARKAEAKKAVGYHCPMHPNFRSDKPGNCGICGMRLVPDEEPHAVAAPESASHPSPEASNMPPGTIHVAAEKQQLIGVRYGTAEYTAASSSFRATGKVTMDERLVAKVQSRIDGWIERVFVDFTGKLVEKGQPLLTVYSPEMLATQQEFLLALRSREIWKGGESLVAASRRRLELWDLGADQIAQVERTGEPIRNITLYAPVTGYVTARNAFPKQRITPETELYTLVDLSRVWIIADVFENEASQVREGMSATLILTYAGGRKVAARVTYIQPQVDVATRTLKVRLEADNPGLMLKPDMFVDVELFTGGARKLTVPAEAVLDTGERKTVYVDRGNGFIEPRAVETGERSSGRIEILSGLKDGERIVTSGNFLIDSESQLRSAASGASAAEHKHD